MNFRKLFTLLTLMMVATFSYGQAVSTSGGAIQGSITDPTGAAIPGASVIISSPATGYTHTLTSDSAGFYSLGPLVPGPYTIKVIAPNFETMNVSTVVRTGTVTNGSEKLTIGKTTETVDVTAGALQVNTDQIGVSGVITHQQIESLPINGRNILDVAQLEPGVILQTGESFDPTKAGYSAISVSGVGGRTTRILLDGQDITDETVGTTIFNVPTGAVEEFQLNRSTQDVSGEVTSTGQVLFSTQSGTNHIHSNVFYNFQDNNAGFAGVNGLNAPFQRNQFGGYFGGPILKDKLFFFGGAERILQHEEDAAQAGPAFADIIAMYPLIPAPFHDTYSTGRLDYDAPHGIHLFARISYSVNADEATFGFSPYSIYENRDNVPAIVGGADFTTGKFTHSVRVGYLKFHNLLQDATSAAGASIYNPFPLGGPNGAITLYDPTDNFYAGPNYLAPQETFQSDKQFRYDGTWTKGAHNVKFGGEVNRILNGGDAPFFGSASLTIFGSGYGNELATCGIAGSTGPCPGDPVNGYGALEYEVGNGNGFFAEKPGFGLAGGGFYSWRIAGYLADSWKVTNYFTFTAGLRWSVDTDRANQDLPTPLCSQVDASIQFPGCTGNTPLFDQYGSTTGSSGYGYRTHQPYGNFGPQAGFVFSPGDHKFSIRGGAGIYYESNVFNNTGNTRTPVITKAGLYQNTAFPCSNIYPGSTITNTGEGVNVPLLCGGESIANAAPQLNMVRTDYQAQTLGIPSSNPDYIGSANGDDLNANNIYAGPYLSPYSIQIDGGIQRQLAKGVIFSADYVHNATLKIPISIDENHVGAARYFNLATAQAAIAATLTQCAATSVAGAIFACPGLHPSVGTAPPGGASIIDFANNGLDSGNNGYNTGGNPAVQTGFAFGGVNPNVGQGLFVLPQGRSGYDAAQFVLQQQSAHPLPGIVSSNVSVSYTLSRIVSSGSQGNGDQFFAGTSAIDYDNPNRFIGRSALDHTNELSFGGSASIRYGLTLGFVGHFFSADPQTLTLDKNQFGGEAEIFRTDVTGDGTTGDVVPGSEVGAYMHAVKGASLNKLIDNYNDYYAGQPTPAGQVLIANGLFTQTQLVALQAVQQPIATAPTTPIPDSAFRTFDVNANYPIRFKRLANLTITPGIAFYNVLNMSNFGHYTGTLLNQADACPNGGCNGVGEVADSLNGPNTQAILNGVRTERASGTFDQGGPRTTEFQLKVQF